MKLYNTLTRNIEPINPIAAPMVTIYTCGPTVYDYPHIGNWFTFIRYDLLVRALKAGNLEPSWVMNITDVGHLTGDVDEGEDKLEKGAKREGKTAWDVAGFYADYFVEGLERLNITTPDKLPRATEHIEEQIALVQLLERKGFTYIIDDGVYFDTSKFPSYGKFAQLDLDEQQAGARVEVNLQKRNASDFALWKLSPQDQKRDMEWDSPWGTGFPGWHIECSAMSMKYLGETLDIHSGGIDHIPVHHTNEIAQSEAATGKQFAHYWMHANHILIGGDKISKSLGNSVTLEEIEAKGFSLQDFRMLVLQSHYRTQSKFTWEDLEAARNRLMGYKAAADILWQPTEKGTFDVARLSDSLTTITEHMFLDLGTVQALAELSAILDDVKAFLIREKDIPAFRTFLKSVDDLLGLQLAETPDIPVELKELITDRQKAREDKDWALSDKLRDKLATQGITVRDTAVGPIWSQR